MQCPACAFDNIEGVDSCDQCGWPLSGLEISDSEIEQALCELTIADLSPPQPISIAPTATVKEAVDAMIGNGVGCLLVQNEFGLLGIVSERDVLYKVDPPEGLQRPVEDIMTRNPETISSEDPVAVALQMMDIGGYRHLPVVDPDGAPVGVISVRDVQRYLCTHIGNLEIQ